MTAEQLTEFLSWDVDLIAQRGAPTLLRDIRVFADFTWSEVVKHPQGTFTNCKSLGNYIHRFTRGSNSRILILSNQDSIKEGRRTDVDGHDVFIVNLVRYKEVASNDAAGAYFAGLQGAPIIDLETLSEDDVAVLLDKLGSADAILDWSRRNPDQGAQLANALVPVAQAHKLDSRIVVRLLKDKWSSMSHDQREGIVSLFQADDFPENLVSAASAVRRQKVVDQYAQVLSDNQWGEKAWQSFFRREGWIFGHGLLYHFLDLVVKETYVGAKEMTNKGGQVADFSVRTIGAGASYIALVDIKTPAANLVETKPCRNGAHAIHGDLAEAVAQIQSNCDVWNRDGSKNEENVLRSVDEGWQTAQPRGIIVIGLTTSLTSRDMRQSFELFRRQLHGVEILTFDELLARAQAIAGQNALASEPDAENDDKKP